jgi:hypothetical protein
MNVGVVEEDGCSNGDVPADFVWRKPRLISRTPGFFGIF